ncbi:hypothetical protein SBOR_3212 [Sclerotinia borealis F-4128]|uniref:DUF7702 domain-containing protein n=1 Tax=Sclerotinia borealis (strain F-4128) TaxID=1432307 RepID=W9CPH5_SCLBF|nr:hypothetical protein SBOR_3212 [Sclerotinia borealis F-4128]
MAITYRNGVGIGELVVYIPSLFLSILLAFRHGFGRSSGWYFLIIFCLARIIGPCMSLAAISSPSVSLFTGALILQNVGLSPLILATLGLLSRVLTSINRNTHTLVQPKLLKLIEILTLIGLILGIVGGINASDVYTTTGIWIPGTDSKVSNILFIVSFVALLVTTILTSFSISHAENGEKRILLAIAIALPFLFIRLLYSILSTFVAHSTKFNSFTGSVSILLCVALLEELVIVVIYLGIGVTLKVQPKNMVAKGELQRVPGTSDSEEPLGQQNHQGQNQNQNQNQKSGAGTVVLGIAKKTIIGRLVMSFVPEKREDVEMQRYARK